jgi:hypothetical protein
MGHIGLVVGILKDGKIAILGGNQGDALTILLYNESVFFTYRLPAGYVPTITKLPTIHLGVHGKIKEN